MPGPRDKRHRTRRSALLKRTTGIPIRHRGGRKPGDARFSCGTASRIDRPLNHHGRCRTNLKRRQAHNDSDQWLATSGLSTPLGFIASPLHRVVRHIARQQGRPSAPSKRKLLPAVFFDASKAHTSVATNNAVIAECLGAKKPRCASFDPKQVRLAYSLAVDEKQVVVTPWQGTINHVYAIEKNISASTHIKGTMPLNATANQWPNPILDLS
jgi:hypothetical protein